MRPWLNELMMLTVLESDSRCSPGAAGEGASEASAVPGANEGERALQRGGAVCAQELRLGEGARKPQAEMVLYPEGSREP